MWQVRLLSRDAQESPLTLKWVSYLGSARGVARDDRVQGTWPGGMGSGMTRAQPPCPAPSRGAPEGRRCDEARQ